MSRELRIGVTGMSPAGEADDPYAGVNLASGMNPNFVDGMNHWAYNDFYAGAISAVDTLPMEFAPDPTMTTACLLNFPVDSGSASITQDMIEIPADMRASLPCDFTVSYWRLQVGGSEGEYEPYRPIIRWYDEGGTLIASASLLPVQRTDVHAWQYDSFTWTIPATAYYVSLSIGYSVGTRFDMYYTATKLERVSPGPPARNLEAFAVSRDSAGILIAVRDNAAPQFAVSRDSGGITLGAWR